ncbi:hypothetical protein [Luteibacter sahnii]|uniref:hypothetical protein n=1 Tax=Luteibacter sahnii TaxID=3021977 RepID=UPI002A6AC186|nr:hypothetical protein [Luteibacter sp. PPL193]MDY1549943.1 hypothetical protein [Luteibacter sp. PPL193]
MQALPAADWQDAMSRPLSPVARLSMDRRIDLERILTEKTRLIVEKQDRIDGQGAIGIPSVHFSDDGTILFVDLTKGYVPDMNGAELEDNLMSIHSELTYDLESIAPVYHVEFLFGGKDIYYYFPEDWRPNPAERSSRAETSSTRAPVAATGRPAFSI